MKRLVMAICMVGLLGAGFFAVNSEAEDSKDGKQAKKITIKIVMQKCMKGGLCKKVADGKADDKEKAQLLEMFKGLAANKAKKGEAESWTAKTKALVAGAQAAVDGKENAGALLSKAMNCKACHSVHK